MNMTLLQFGEKIGPAGTILIFLSAVSLYLSLKNALYLYLIGHEFKTKIEDVETGSKKCMHLNGPESGNPLIAIIASVVQTHFAHSRDLRAEVAYLFHRNFEKVNKGLTYLRLISVISPLLGLLGTVLGMVDVFKVIATQANPDSTLLAGGIWEAMLTTVMGLSVAIPTLFFYYSLSLKVKGFRIEAIEHSYRALEIHGLSSGFEKAESVGFDDKEKTRSAVGENRPAVVRA